MKFTLLQILFIGNIHMFSDGLGVYRLFSNCFHSIKEETHQTTLYKNTVASTTKLETMQCTELRKVDALKAAATTFSSSSDVFMFCLVFRNMFSSEYANIV